MPGGGLGSSWSAASSDASRDVSCSALRLAVCLFIMNTYDVPSLNASMPEADGTFDPQIAVLQSGGPYADPQHQQVWRSQAGAFVLPAPNPIPASVRSLLSSTAQQQKRWGCYIAVAAANEDEQGLRKEFYREIWYIRHC
eukprot:1144649-Pelagomonas_calceolata.AAC.1